MGQRRRVYGLLAFLWLVQRGRQVQREQRVLEEAQQVLQAPLVQPVLEGVQQVQQVRRVLPGRTGPMVLQALPASQAQSVQQVLA